MQKILNYLQTHKKVASFYYDPADTDVHLTGYVLAFNEDELLIAHITPYGYKDGFILKRISAIYHIDYDGKYEHKIEKLYRLNQQVHEKIDLSQTGNGRILHALLDWAVKKNVLATVEFETNCLTGFVNKYENDLIFLRLIDDYGEENGTSVVDLNEVLTISVNSTDEQALQRLFFAR